MASRRLLLTLAAALVAAGLAHGQDAAAPARDRLGRFLAEGRHAPFAGKTRQRALDGFVATAPLVAGELTFARPGELVASVGSSGEVTFFSRSRPLLFVEGTGAARDAELRRRVKHSLDDAATRARQFLEDRYPAFRERRFELVHKERQDHDSLVQDELVFVERPGAGVAACWPNRIEVSLNPEDGSVVSYAATHERVESRAAPLLGPEAARAALVRTVGDRVRPENRDFLATARLELVAARGRDGRPRTAWLIAGLFLVDAGSGELLAGRGGRS